MNNDVSSIIGDYVKRDNEVEEIFKRVDRWVNYLSAVSSSWNSLDLTIDALTLSTPLTRRRRQGIAL